MSASAQWPARWALRGCTLAIRLYQLLLSPFLGGRCRFFPSCSVYGLHALRAHGPGWGLWLTLRRLLRCHPWHPGGLDPVVPPPNEEPLSSHE